MFGRLPDALTIARSGVVDRDYYRAQAGQRFSTDLAAARHYLASGAANGLSLHPLFEPEFVEAKARPNEELLRYLTDAELQKKSPHPAFDLKLARKQLRDAGAKAPRGVWLAWVNWAKDATPVPAPGSPVAWSALRTALIQAARDWRESSPVIPANAGISATQIPGQARDDVEERPSHVFRHPGESRDLISIVVPITSLKDVVSRLSLLTGDQPHELVGIASTRAQFCALTALAQCRPIVVVRDPEPNLAQQWNRGAAASTGDRLVFVAPHAALKAPVVDQLASALAEPGVAVAQPLNEDAAMLIASAGAYFPPNDVAPSPLLAGHPTTDAQHAGQETIPAALSAVVAVRREVFAHLGGFDADFINDLPEVDFSLRAAEAGVGAARLVAEASVTLKPRPRTYPFTGETSLESLRRKHRASPSGSADWLAAAGFAVADHDGSTPVLARSSFGVSAVPRLRWTIDTPVTAGWWAQIWGDWHFAHSLARALRRLGQEVAVDTRQARDRESRRFDDVQLVIRGLDVVPAAPGRVNLIWVISHPDEVSSDELAGYDHVFAASESWAASKSAEWGRTIEPLLQCTDAEFFHPGRSPEEASFRARPGIPEGATASRTRSGIPDAETSEAEIPGQARDDERNHALFVGNYRPDRVRPIVNAALASGIDLDLYGTGWEDLPGASDHVRGRKVPNTDLGRLYAGAGVVLNDHWDDMRRTGFISNRLFDAVACCARVLSDRPAIPASAGTSSRARPGIFDGSVQYADTPAEAQRLLQDLDGNWPSREQRLATAARIRSEHSFDQRAKLLLDRATEAVMKRAHS